MSSSILFSPALFLAPPLVHLHSAATVATLAPPCLPSAVQYCILFFSRQASNIRHRQGTQGQRQADTGLWAVKVGIAYNWMRVDSVTCLSVPKPFLALKLHRTASHCIAPLRPAPRRQFVFVKNVRGRSASRSDDKTQVTKAICAWGPPSIHGTASNSASGAEGRGRVQFPGPFCGE